MYVQDRLRESGGLVWRLLQRGAHFYVCGDAAHMAGSVEEALLEIIAQHQVRIDWWDRKTAIAMRCMHQSQALSRTNQHQVGRPVG